MGQVPRASGFVRIDICIRRSLWLLFSVCIFSSSFAQIPFQENKGQWNNQVLFRYQSEGVIVYLRDKGVSFLQYDNDTWREYMDHGHNTEKSVNSPDKKHKDLDCHHFQLQFLESNNQCVIEGLNALDHRVNYLLGNEPDKWVEGAQEFPTVIYRDLYPNIDLIAYTHGYGFKYDFLLKKGARIEDIKLRYDFVDDFSLNSDQLKIKTSLGTIKESMPKCLVRYEGIESPVDIEYTAYEDGSFGFRFSPIPIPVYDSLLIDPEVVFATYAGNTADNFGFTATYDIYGHLYSGGITTAADFGFDRNGRYPATTGAFSTSYTGGVNDFSEYGFACDITISKYSADGTSLIYATYIGGTHNEYPHSIVADDNQNLVIFGTSFSRNYPTTAGCYQNIRNGEEDIIVSKLNSSGGQLLGSTYIGGGARDGLNEASILKFFYADNHRGEVILDVNGLIYVATNTYSDDFPMVDAFQDSKDSKQDGVFIQFNSDLTDVLWSSYFGGSNDDAFYSLDLDSKGLIFLSGGTKSTNLKGTSGTIHENFLGGPADGFIAVLDPSSKSLLRSTYFGTSEYEQIFSLDIDQFDQVYVTGHSVGDVPIVGDVHSEPKSGQFITKMNPELSKIEFSTVFGSGDGSPDITINAFLVDECQKIFVSGWGGNTSGKSFSSTNKLPITPDAWQKTTDGSDFYLYVLSKGAKELLYATYFGGTRTNDHVDGGTSRFDKKGFIYQSVCGSCPEQGSNETRISDFPTTPNAYSPKNLSPRCSNVAFKLAFGNLNRAPRLADELYRVTAFDTLDLEYLVYDPDEDSIFLLLNPSLKLRPKMIDFKDKVSGMKEIKLPLHIQPLCDDVGDTLEMFVYAVDQGCPLSLDSNATIKIVVDPPPVVDPPETLCMVFNGESELKLTWDAIPQNKLFKSLTLFRTDPDGNTKSIYTSTNYQGGSYVDKDIKDPKRRNYTYFMSVLNLCDEEGPASLKVSTTKEFESPIDVTYIEFVTVTNDDKVHIRWLKSEEADFGYYDIYRRENTPKASFQYLASTYAVGDTNYIDKDVKVNELSYCYVLVVNDNCGHVSANSNPACTILLLGESKPFKHELDWNRYEEWNGGVSSYSLLRSVDTGILRPLIQFQTEVLEHTDSSLDYCWGGYWYRVKAEEGFGSLDAQSYSNRVYLIQPPLLHVPNAFTPNDNGLNELWGIVPVFVKEYEVQVYTRWGEKVYDSNNVKTDWDGYYHEKIEPNSVYMYIIRFTGWDRSVHYRKGTVTILK
jgi:gliding motility-associated-like protein